MIKQIQSQLDKAYPYRTELHCHTNPASPCSHSTPEQVMQDYLAAGVHSVTLTNHFAASHWDVSNPQKETERWLSDYNAVCECAKGTDLTILLGMEIRFPQCFNDYLVYGLDPTDIERIIPMLTTSLEDFYREWKDERRLILQAHPFRPKTPLAPLDAIDGIEMFNLNPNHNSAVSLAAQYAKEHGLIISGGSDYHASKHTGLCLIRTKERMMTSYDVARVLRSGDFLFEISGNLMLPQQ